MNWQEYHEEHIRKQNTNENMMRDGIEKGELFVQAARLGESSIISNSLSCMDNEDTIRDRMFEAYIIRDRVYEALQAAALNGHASIVSMLLDRCKSNRFIKLGDYIYYRFLPDEQSKLYSQYKSWYFYGEEMVSSPLHLAVKEGHVKVVQEIINFLNGECILPSDTVAKKYHGKDNKRNMKEKIKAGIEWLQWLLEWAVRWGHARIVEVLLAGQRPLQVGLFPITKVCFPLHLAAHLCQFDVLKVLLQFLPLSICSEPSFRSKDGLSALHLAAQSGCLSTAELLINTAKMDVNLRSHPELFTPLHMAAGSGRIEMVRFLLQCKAQLDIRLGSPMERDCMGRTPLHYAAREGYASVALELLNCAVGTHTDIASIADSDGLLPLHMAAKGGHVEVIKMLRRHGGINRKAKHSLIMRSLVKREYMSGDIIKRHHVYYGERWKFHRPRLIDSLFWKTEGFTPLHFAARYGHHESVKELLKEESNDHLECGQRAAADVLLKDSGGFLAYDWMQVQKQGENFLKHVHEGVHGGYVADRLVESLNKASYIVNNPTSEIRILEIKSDIAEEKQALEELQQAYDGLTPVSSRTLIFQWLLTHEFGITGEHHPDQLSNWHIKSNGDDVFRAIGECLDKHNFVGAKEILLLQPEIARDVRLCKKVMDAVLTSASFIEWEGLSASWSFIKWEGLSEDVKVFLMVLLRRDGTSNLLRWLLRWAEYTKMDDLMEEVIAKKVLISGSSIEEDVKSFVMVLVRQDGLVGASDSLKGLLLWAKVRKMDDLVEVILDHPELKQGLFHDRQVYLDYANAILVGAALIAGLAFQGWLQPPLGYSFVYEGENYAGVHHRAVRIFWWFNNGAFFLATGALAAGAKGAVPVPKDTDIISSLFKVRRAVVVASVLLSVALLCVAGAFAAAGFAVLPPLSRDLNSMRISMGFGATVFALSLIWFCYGLRLHILETFKTILYSVFGLAFQLEDLIHGTQLLKPPSRNF